MTFVDYEVTPQITTCDIMRSISSLSSSLRWLIADQTDQPAYNSVCLIIITFLLIINCNIYYYSLCCPMERISKRGTQVSGCRACNVVRTVLFERSTAQIQLGDLFGDSRDNRQAEHHCPFFACQEVRVEDGLQE